MSNPFENESVSTTIKNGPDGTVYTTTTTTYTSEPVTTYTSTPVTTYTSTPVTTYTTTPIVTEKTEVYPQKMPSPSDYTTTNAWQESNKTLEESPKSAVVNAYQDAPISTQEGPKPHVNAYQQDAPTYGNTTPGNAYSHATDPEPSKAEKVELPPKERSLPSKFRWLLRVILLIAAVGSFGFAAGAHPYSGESNPLQTKAIFYYLYAIAAVSFFYSAYHIIFFCFRRFGNAQRIKRIILILSDLLMAILWGIGVIITVIKNSCKPGQHNGWCNFYNGSIFFGYLSLAIYVILFIWDAFGCICGGRGKKD